MLFQSSSGAVGWPFSTRFYPSAISVQFQCSFRAAGWPFSTRFCPSAISVQFQGSFRAVGLVFSILTGVFTSVQQPNFNGFRFLKKWELLVHSSFKAVSRQFQGSSSAFPVPMNSNSCRSEE